MNIAYAHALYDPLPPTLFAFKFELEPTILFFVVLGTVYALAYRRRSDRRIKLWQRICFYIGVITALLSLLPPIDPLSDQLFFMHMVQHMLIVFVAVPLILFGAPIYVILQGAPPTWRRRFILPLLRHPLFRWISNVALNPIVAMLLFIGNFWLWHVPEYYNAALLDDRYHLLEHALMAFTAFLLWRNIIDPFPLRSPLHMGFRLIFLGVLMMIKGVFGAALSFSTDLWYAYDGIPTPGWWAESWTQLDDQKLGGLIMWVPGATMIFISMTICFFVWVSREQRRDQADQAGDIRGAQQLQRGFLRS